MRIYSSDYLQALRQSAEEGPLHLDPELFLDKDFLEAAENAAGAMIGAAKSATEEGLAFCLSRPGSHHAGRSFALGLCLFNNLALSAAWARSMELGRVAILDFDAHHGNGTEEIF